MPEEPSKQGRAERKKDKMRQRIITVALELFHKQGFDATTMEQIAEEVDIAKKTLYNYFSVKEAIISDYVQGIIQDVKMNVDEFLPSFPHIRSSALAMFQKAAQMYEADPEIWRVYVAYRIRNKLNLTKDMDLRSGLEDLFKEMLLQGQIAGQIRKDISAKELARHLEMNYSMSLMAWLADPEHSPLGDSLAWCIDIFLDGAKAR